MKCFHAFWKVPRRISKTQALIITYHIDIILFQLVKSPQKSLLLPSYTHIPSQTKALPFAAEVQSSGQTYNQQTDTEDGDKYLLFCHWLNDELRVATPGAVVALLTPAAQRDESCMITPDD